MSETSGHEGDRRRSRGDGDRRRPRRGERDGRFNTRRDEAVRHTAQMHDRFAEEIERSVKATRFYDAAPKAPEDAQPVVPSVSVVDEDSVTAALKRGRGRAELSDLALLDFASFTHPGGGYDRGTMAQEEALCTESFLYNVLKRFDGWFAENRRRNINCELYRDRAFVAPKVRFERDRLHSYADVIVAAAPNARRAIADYHVDAKTLESAMRSRIRLVLAIADARGYGTLLLGAFGCGVFGWDAAAVAEMFRSELARGTHVAHEVVFAVPQGSHDENLEHFQHAFATFPEHNAAAYLSRAERAAHRDEPGDEDEGERDWRKYL